jgi:hypothetical protein
VSSFRPLSVLILSGLASLVLCAGAQAGIVTVGSQSTAPTVSVPIGEPVTLFNTALAPGAKLTSPVTGTIVRWRLSGAVGGPFKLRLLTPLGGQNFLGGGASAPVTPLGAGTETFPTNLPIKAGQLLAVDNANASDQLGAVASPSSSYSYYLPPLAEGASDTATGPNSGAEFTYNADVLPPPTFTALSPNTGSIKGGTSVLISGTNLIEVSAVRFGAVPAASFVVQSENLISAVAPAGSAPGPVDVTITTPAGTTPVTAADQFAYTACVVPKLTGKKLKGAKKRIRKAGCKVGIVKKLGGATAKTGVVVKQSPKAGKVLAPGTKVNVKLGA